MPPNWYNGSEKWAAGSFTWRRRKQHHHQKTGGAEGNPFLPRLSTINQRSTKLLQRKPKPFTSKENRHEQGRNHERRARCLPWAEGRYSSIFRPKQPQARRQD